MSGPSRLVPCRCIGALWKNRLMFSIHGQERLVNTILTIFIRFQTLSSHLLFLVLLYRSYGECVEVATTRYDIFMVQ
ncbi:hypothetical protein M405DRAFT_434036 [Rhizopogon salebrosus TDB-379]|nr:hypothetical protein M405DRAFT_434036 [Rhizopogon salebrosus TDB-379]